MRLWSLHPRYLDSKGLVALWREALLAKKVLGGDTKGYRNHPQLTRFREWRSPQDAIDAYLLQVYRESEKRNFNFDRKKISDIPPAAEGFLPVTEKQVEYERSLLLDKLWIRDEVRYRELKNAPSVDVNGIFRVIGGEIENWEKVKNDGHDQLRHCVEDL